MNKRRILVVGAGIGGLTAAVALAQKGCDVTVVERGDGSEPDGVGISQQANVVRAVAGLGLAEDYLAAGFAYEATEIHAPDGTVVARAPVRSLIPGYPGAMGIPRKALRRLLTNAALAAGATLRYSTTVAGIEDGRERVDVTLSDGSGDAFCAVVGADGIYSQIRQTIFPAAPAPQYVGQAVWRYSLPRPAGFEALHVYNGPTGIGLVPMSEDEIYLYVTTPEPGDPVLPKRGLAAALRGRLAGCPAPAIAEIREKLVDDAAVVYRPLETIFLEGPWHRGRIVLLGDAVHATTPHLGQGGGMAMEDAVVLAEEFARSEHVASAFAAYRARRFDRCRYVVEKSLEICRGQLGQGPLIDNAKAGAEMAAVLAEPL